MIRSCVVTPRQQQEQHYGSASAEQQSTAVLKTKRVHVIFLNKLNVFIHQIMAARQTIISKKKNRE